MFNKNALSLTRLDSLPVVAHPLPCHGQSYGWRRRKLAPVCTGLAFSAKTPLREWDSRGALTKKARCLSTASFLLTRDSVGIRTQDPQLRRLLLYPAELPNHPYVSTRRLPFCEEQVCKYRDFLFNGNVSRRKFLQILYALWSITHGYRPARKRHLYILK